MWVPAAERVTEVRYCSEPVVINCCRRFLHNSGEKFECVDDAVALTDGGLGQVVVHEFDGVRVQQRLCGGVGHVEAAVVVECRADTESLAAAEVPRSTHSWLAVDYDRAAHGAHGSFIEVKRAVVVFPG